MPDEMRSQRELTNDPRKALRFRKADLDVSPVLCEVDIGQLLDLLAKEPVPAVFLLRSQDLEALLSRAKALGDVVSDRGVQNVTEKNGNKKTMPLTQCFQSVTGHGAIQTQYSQATRLPDAIEKFLVRCNDHLYFLGTSDEIFAELCGAANLPVTSDEPAERPDFSASDEIPDDKLAPGEAHARKFLKEQATLDTHQWSPLRLRKIYRGNSYWCERVRCEIISASQSKLNVLITGETGTGKDYVAHNIHNEGSRRAGPYIPKNCAAISPFLFELEMFGGRKNYPNPGTPATIGLIEQADGGTLFLDEFGDLDPSHQAKLLRAIEDKQIKRLGEDRYIDVDVRFICATNHENKIRKELFFRAAALPIQTPPLREHPWDIKDLANANWQVITQDPNRTLQAETVQELEGQNWIGNVRELRNTLFQMHWSFGVEDSRYRLQLIREKYMESDEASTPVLHTVPADLIDMVDVLAEASHENWRSMREKDGWVYGPVRVEKDNRKENPDIVPWRDLPESEKAYARGEAKTIIYTLLDRGIRLDR